MDLLADVVEVVVAGVAVDADVIVLSLPLFNGHGHIQRRHLGMDADGFQISLEHLGGLGAVGGAGGQNGAHIDTVGIAGLGQQGLGLLGVVGIGLKAGGGLGGAVLGNHVGIGGLAVALGHSQIHIFLVDGIEHSLADQVIIQNRSILAGVVDTHPNDVVAGDHGAVCIAGLLVQRVPIGEGGFLIVVQLTVLIGDDGGGGVSKHAVLDLLDVGSALPILVIGGQLRTGGDIVLGDIIGTGAGGVGDGAELIALLGHFVLLHDLHAEQGVSNGGVGILHVNDEGLIIRGFHAVDHGGQVGHVGVFEGSLIGEDAVRSGEEFPVLEGDAILEGDGVGHRVIADLNILGQLIVIAALGFVHAVQPLIDLIIELDVVGIVAVCGVKGSVCGLGSEDQSFFAGIGVVVGVLAAAGQKTQSHDDCEAKRDNLFHTLTPLF